jgi:hypothetical protein
MLTVVVRNEVDVIDAQLAFHLNAGVDFVFATDHDSRDGTTEILESYERAGYLRLWREQGEVFRQGEWMTRMARLAATERKADWVILSDADEFWWPRAASLKEALSAVPQRYGVIHAPQRYFLPRPDDGQFFAERMTALLSAQAPINDPLNTFRPVAKVVHRADPRVRIPLGNHVVIDPPFVRWPGRSPIEVLHFPKRTPRQFERKTRTVEQTIGPRHRGDFARAQDALGVGRFDVGYAASVVDDDGLERGLAEGFLLMDTRLRDVLRDLRRPGDGEDVRHFLLPDELGRPLELGPPHVGDLVAEAVHAETLREADTIRLRRRLDELESRIAALSP